MPANYTIIYHSAIQILQYGGGIPPPLNVQACLQTVMYSRSSQHRDL